MYTLALETSTRTPGAALLNEDFVLGCVDGKPGKQASARFPVLIRELLAQHAISPRDPGLIAVSIGPGSFTGLRVGVTMAKTWAWATGAALVAVPSLKAIAHGVLARPAAYDCPLVRVVCDAQRQQVHVATWERSGDELVARPGPRIIDLANVTGELPQHSLLVLVEPVHPDVIWPADLVVRVVPDPVAVAHLGRRLYQQGKSIDPVSLVPLYGRDSAATEKKLATRAP